MFKKKKVGLVLGSGGARGLAHIGVLKVFEENGIEIDMISGASIGALIGALYSAEMNSKKLKKDALSMNLNKLFDYTISRSGFIKGKRIENFLDERLGNLKFKDLKIPLYVTAFDIDNNQEIVFNRGNVAKAVRSSISIPGVFFPTRNGGKNLVDGGVVDPLPIEILKKKGADIIIVVNVEEFEGKPPIEATARRSDKKHAFPNILKVLQSASNMMTHENCEFELLKNKADVVICPRVSKINMMDFHKAKKAIRRGQRAAKKSLRQIKRLTSPNLVKELIEEVGEEIAKEGKKFGKK